MQRGELGPGCHTRGREVIVGVTEGQKLGMLRHILSPAAIAYADVHGTYCQQSSEQKQINTNNKLRDDDDDDDMMIITVIETFLPKLKVHHTSFTENITSESLNTAVGELFFFLFFFPETLWP